MLILYVKPVLLGAIRTIYFLVKDNKLAQCNAEEYFSAGSAPGKYEFQQLDLYCVSVVP